MVDCLQARLGKQTFSIMQLTKINGKYELFLPEHRAAREQWDIAKGGWEVARIEEMLDVLTPNDILFDLGTEEGDISALLVKESGCKIVLVEPNNRVWGCMKAIWEANELPTPLSFYPGFFSSKTETHEDDSIQVWDTIEKVFIADHGFKQLYENYPNVPQITLDDFVELSEIIPTVITMDVEGSEFEVLKGAEKTLKEYRPIIFLSLHPEFMFEMYRHESRERFGEEKQFCNQLLRFVDECGYTHRVIEWDYHECHIRFDPIK